MTNVPFWHFQISYGGLLVRGNLVRAIWWTWFGISWCLAYFDGKGSTGLVQGGYQFGRQFNGFLD